MSQLEAKIAEWRRFVVQRPGVAELDAAELEGHLRDQIADLGEAGLTPDEAFLIAVQRLGNLDDVAREVHAASTPAGCGSNWWCRVQRSQTVTTGTSPARSCSRSPPPSR